MLDTPFASGRNESSTPAAMVQAAKISGSRSAAPGARRPARVGRGGAVRLAAARPGSQRIVDQRQQAGRRRDRRYRRAQVVPGEPDPGRQRDHGRDAGDEAEQAEPFAAPLGGKQRARSSAPVVTPHRPKPSPRTKLTPIMTACGSRGSRARAGAPSSTAPAASIAR